MSSFFFSLMTMVAVFFFLDDLAQVKIFWMSILSSEIAMKLIDNNSFMIERDYEC